ncbi:MAG: NAD(P)-dependent glycerol-3-phosphate dehydrogenase [Methylococcaceae bacterium]|nr:NAD(P)-dependent glycerol-3-phosphate dehydrogenase [Methylococcaceae bacterium]
MGIKIAVIGAGSWGTALAVLIAGNGHPVRLWAHRPEHAEKLAVERRNRRYLPDAEFPERLDVVPNLAAAVAGRTAVIVAVPSHAFRATLNALAPALPPDCAIAWATKGLEDRTTQLLHQVTREVLGSERPLAALSGPTFAGEVAAGQPTAMTVASSNPRFAQLLVDILHNRSFRPYTTDDLIGVQLGGATKNVLAIAAGVADGLGFGANARAALITRGLSEMMRLGMAMGGRRETLMGLAGVGDLILTCTDNQSRNRRFGLGLGQGRPRDQVIADIGQEIEGIGTAHTLYQLATANGVDMPISEQVYRILYQNLTPADAVDNLLLREPKAELIATP